MKRVLIRKPGGHDALDFVESPDPAPGPGQVRVRVKAAGVNYADVLVRMGHYEAAKGLYPMTPGFEFAGVVDACGAGVARFKEGDKVFGIARFGAYSDVFIATERQLWPCPKGWDFADCAAFPAVFLTAHHALFKVAHVEPGETLLVHSAAGGVGSALLQLATMTGCRSVAVVGSPEKADLCRRLGADTVILRTPRLWEEADRAAPQGFDAVFDANGVGTLREAFTRLAVGGRLVVYGFADIVPRGSAKPSLLQLAKNYIRVPRFSPLDMTASNRAVMGFNIVFLFHKLELAEKSMGEMLRWIEEGRIQKTPVTLFPLDRVVDAHRAIESGRTQGKLILTM